MTLKSRTIAIFDTAVFAVSLGFANYLLLQGIWRIGAAQGAPGTLLLCLACLVVPGLMAWRSLRNPIVPGPLYLAGESGHKRRRNDEAYSLDRRRGDCRL